MLNEIDIIGNALGEWSMTFNALSVILRLVICVLLSSILGLERSSKRHSAGLRTFVIISLAGCVAGIVDNYLHLNMYYVSCATIIGVAIIATNTTLFTSRSQIKGLTTSVALWLASFQGIAIGLGLYFFGICIFVVTIIVLAALPELESFLKDRSNHFEIHLELTNASFLKDFITTTRKLGLVIDEIEQNAAYIGSQLSVYSIGLSIKSKELKKYKTHKEIIEALSSLEYIYHIEEM